MGAYQNYVSSLSPQPVVWFKFDELGSATTTIADSGTANNGLIAGTDANTTNARKSTGGKDGGHINPLSDNSISLTDATSVIPAYLNYTLSFWIKRNLPGTGTYTGTSPFGWTGGSGQYRTQSGTTASIESDGKLYWYAVHGGVSHTDFTTNDLRTNEWIHITYTRNSNVVKLYQNGVLLATRTDAGTASNPGLTGTYSFRGAGFGGTGLDEWLLFNYTMTDEQVLALYQHTPPGVNVTVNEAAATASATAPNSTNSAAVNKVETPATASALQVDPLLVSASSNLSVDVSTASALMINPTVSITTPNSTQTWTSVTADAIFVNPSSVIASINISNTSDVFLASADIGDHVGIASADILQLPQSTTATALMVNPFFAGSGDKVFNADPMLITNATIPGYGLIIPPTYDSLVLGDSPILFVNQNTLSPINKGTGNFGIPTFGAGWSLQPSGVPMSANGEGTSWYAQQGGGSDTITWSDSGSVNALYNMHLQPNWTYEWWFKPESHTWDNSATNPIYYLLDNGYIRIASIENGPDASPSGLSIYMQILDNSTQLALSTGYQSVPTLNQWHHIVFTSTQEGSNTRFKIWVDGSVRDSRIIASSDLYTTSKVNSILTAGLKFFPQGFITPNGWLDQIAIYNRTLTNAEIAEHYDFILTNDGRRVVGAEYLTADANIGDHTVYSIANLNYPATPVTASILSVNPNVVTSTTINVSATPLACSATTVTPNTFVAYNLTYNAFPFNGSSANMPGGFFQNTTYSAYVTSLSPTPWRYHSLDSAFDWITGQPQNTTNAGTDTAYSFNMFGVGTGTHSQAVSKINNYSVLSELDYDIDQYSRSLTIYESEYNDDWGSVFSNNGDGWTTSFWLRSHPDHPVGDGAVVLFTIRSNQDTDSLMIYHVNNKLMVEIRDNNNYISYESPSNVNIFDQNRHQITMTYHRDGTNSHPLVVYVDGVAVISENTGAINPTFRQGPYIQGPNTTNWIKAALGGFTLPRLNYQYFLQNNSYPQFTKLYFDEFIWLKWDMNATQVQNLYNAMPIQGEIYVTATPITASALTVQPTISLGITKEGPAMNAVNGIVVQPTIYREFNLSFNASVLTASATFVDPSAVTVNINPVLINADLFAAGADMVAPTIILSVQGATMYATVAAVNAQPYFDEYLLLIMMQTHTTQGSVTTFGGRWGIGDHDA